MKKLDKFFRKSQVIDIKLNLLHQDYQLKVIENYDYNFKYTYILRKYPHFKDRYILLNLDTFRFLVGEDNYAFYKKKKCIIKLMVEFENSFWNKQYKLRDYLELLSAMKDVTCSYRCKPTSLFSFVNSIYGSEYWFNILKYEKLENNY